MAARLILDVDYTVPGAGPRVVVSTTAFHARVRGLKETKKFLPHPLVKLSIVR